MKKTALKINNFTFSFSQVSLTNWVAGGKSSASGIFMVNWFAKYKKDNISWDNTVDVSYGFLKEKNNEVVKSDDKIDFSSKLGIVANNKWNYSGLVNFKSQFAPGYNYPNTDDVDVPVDNDGDGTIDETGPRIQFMEMFGVGLSYKF